jgi:hypothetical protein
MAAQKPAKGAKPLRKGFGGRTRGTWGPDNPPPKSPGRPACPEDVRQAFRALTPKAVAALEAALREGGNVAVRAAEVLLERGWGRVAQAIELDATMSDTRGRAAALAIAESRPELAALIFGVVSAVPPAPETPALPAPEPAATAKAAPGDAQEPAQATK